MLNRWIAVTVPAAALGALAAIVQPGAAQAPAAQEAARRPVYAALADLPDFTGTWVSFDLWVLRRMINTDALNERPPFRDPAVLERFQAQQRQANTGGDNVAAARGGGGGPARGGGAPAGGRGAACTPGQIAGAEGGRGVGAFNGRLTLGPVGAVEVLYTPGRVMMISSGGAIRRIYTDGTTPSDPTYITLMGFSAGRWDRNALAIETTALSPTATILGMAPAGTGFKVRERWFLKERDVLQIETTLEAPEVLTRPYTMPPQLWARIPFAPAVIQDALGYCADFDRSVDSANGRQTFDLTPPKDLPPPPR